MATPRSKFDLSYTKNFSASFNLLYPVLHDEVLPGDYIKLGCSAVVRMQPMVSPCMTPITVYAYFFFIPYRILWNQWEEFITGGKNGDGGVNVVPVLPRFNFPVTNPTPQEQQAFKDLTGVAYNYNAYDMGSLWDFFGMPIRRKPLGQSAPLDFPWRAYSLVWNKYFRDENLTMEIDIDGGYSPYLLPAAYKKDYFTSALPFQQRGISPAIPITGTGAAVWPSTVFTGINTNQVYNFDFGVNRSGGPSATNNAQFVSKSSDPGQDQLLLRRLFNANVVDLTNVGGIQTSDIRLVAGIAQMQELSARGGYRYVEQLQAFFGITGLDARLQLPEYIGGFKMPVVVSEVLQTSETTANSPQGNLAGHGLSVDGKYVGSYRVKEHGMLLGVMCIRTPSLYQDGINRQWLRQTRYDFYWHQLAHLSEQGIYNGELFTADNDEDGNLDIWGYQQRYDEYRHKHDIVCGQMRSYQPDDYGNGMTAPTPPRPASLDFWNLARKFNNRPGLNWDFVRSSADNRIFAVQNEDTFLIQWRNSFKAVRQIPKFGNPGMHKI